MGSLANARTARTSRFDSAIGSCRAESDDAPRPYLHSMGPRDDRGSMRAGLRADHRFGVIGSSDHHAAHPGSHDHGRLGVWVPQLTRDAIWRGLDARRTWPSKVTGSCWASR